MIIRQSAAIKPFTQIDKAVFTDRRLSDGAKVLYGYMRGLQTGMNYSDKYVVKAMGISQRVLTNRKKELKDADLILMDQLTPRLYVIYIGHTRKGAMQVKAEWGAREDVYGTENNVEQM